MNKNPKEMTNDELADELFPTDAEKRDAESYLFTLRYRLATGPVTIRAWEASHYDSNGARRYPHSSHVRIDCELRQNGKVIFKRGDTYCATPGCIDGNEAKELVTSLFAMKPGDTDDEYFEGYTAEQLEWAETNGEELSMMREMRYCDENGNVKGDR